MNYADQASVEAQTMESLVERWYRALDQRQITIGSKCWLALLRGIHVHDGDLWIQISHAEAPEQSVVLHVSPHTSIDSALAAARTWSLRGPDPSTVHVTPACSLGYDGIHASVCISRRLPRPGST